MGIMIMPAIRHMVGSGQCCCAAAVAGLAGCSTAVFLACRPFVMPAFMSVGPYGFYSLHHSSDQAPHHSRPLWSLCGQVGFASWQNHFAAAALDPFLGHQHAGIADALLFMHLTSR